MSKGKGKNSNSPFLQGKSYKDAVNDLISSIVLQPRDIDQKCVQLLDALHKAGKAEEGVKHLKTSLDGLAREKVQNWKAYTYKLLREFDIEVYTAMKEKAAGGRQQKAKDKKDKDTGGSLNSTAPEFRPGQWWSGAVPMPGPGGVPQTGYPPMMMMAPQMMMPQAAMVAGAPPPPPAKAAAVPKAAAKEAPAPTNPAPEPAAEAKEAEKTETEAR